jgi:hypothetical protein
MRPQEIQQRVAGLLSLFVDEEWPGDERNDQISLLMEDVLTVRLTVRSDASHQDVAQAVMADMEERVTNLIAAFCAAFASLAEVHDTGHSEMSARDVIQALALEWARGEDGAAE